MFQVDPTRPVLVAGDPERAHETRVNDDGGICYHVNLVTAMERLATRLGVKPMTLKTM